MTPEEALSEAEAQMKRAEVRVLDDASPDNLRRLTYWQARVRELRALQKKD